MSAIDDIKKKRETKQAAPEDLPVLFQALAEFVANSADVQAEISSIDDMSVNFKVRDSSVAAKLVLAGGKLTAGSGLADPADATIEMTGDIAKRMVIGETEAIREGYMSGDITIDGDMSKLMAMRPIFEVVREKMGGGA